MYKHLLTTLVSIIVLAHAANAAVLTDNLSSPVTDSESVGGSNWIAAQFGTGSTTYTLSSITLIMRNVGTGTAQLSVYTQGLSGPASLVGTLSSPASYSGAFSPTSFGGNGVFLQPNSAYWAVLQASSGMFDWAWTDTETGNGPGFSNAWAASIDAGANWLVFVGQPMLMRVEANSNVAPEPGSLSILALIGLPFVVILLIRLDRGNTGAVGSPAPHE